MRRFDVTFRFGCVLAIAGCVSTERFEERHKGAAEALGQQTRDLSDQHETIGNGNIEHLAELVAVACSVRILGETIEETSMEKPNLQEVIERHRKRLLKIDGIVGIAVGAAASDPNRRCIIVYASMDDWPAELPRELDGYDVELHKSSGFHAL